MFFHLLQTTLYGTPHSTFIYALGLGNLAIALAEDNTGIHSAALDPGRVLRAFQRVQN